MTVTEGKEAKMQDFLAANNLTDRAEVEGTAIVLEEAGYVDDTSAVFGVLPLIAVLGFLFIANVGYVIFIYASKIHRLRRCLWGSKPSPQNSLLFELIWVF